MKKRQRPRDWSAEDELFRRQVRTLCGVSGMTQEELALRLDMSTRTLRSRMRQPDTLTKREERVLFELMQGEGLAYQAGFEDAAETPRLRIAQ